MQQFPAPMTTTRRVLRFCAAIAIFIASPPARGVEVQNHDRLQGLLVGVPQPISRTAVHQYQVLLNLAPEQLQHCLASHDAYLQNYNKLRGEQFEQLSELYYSIRDIPLRRPADGHLDRYLSLAALVDENTSILDDNFFAMCATALTPAQSNVLEALKIERELIRLLADPLVAEWFIGDGPVNIAALLDDLALTDETLQLANPIVQDYRQRLGALLTRLKRATNELRKNWHAEIRRTDFQEFDLNNPQPDNNARRQTMQPWAAHMAKVHPLFAEYLALQEQTLSAIFNLLPPMDSHRLRTTYDVFEYGHTSFSGDQRIVIRYATILNDPTIDKAQKESLAQALEEFIRLSRPTHDEIRSTLVLSQMRKLPGTTLSHGMRTEQERSLIFLQHDSQHRDRAWQRLRQVLGDERFRTLMNDKPPQLLRSAILAPPRQRWNARREGNVLKVLPMASAVQTFLSRPDQVELKKSLNGTAEDGSVLETALGNRYEQAQRTVSTQLTVASALFARSDDPGDIMDVRPTRVEPILDAFTAFEHVHDQISAIDRQMIAELRRAVSLDAQENLWRIELALAYNRFVDDGREARRFVNFNSILESPTLADMPQPERAAALAALQASAGDLGAALVEDQFARMRLMFASLLRTAMRGGPIGPPDRINLRTAGQACAQARHRLVEVTDQVLTKINASLSPRFASQFLDAYLKAAHPEIAAWHEQSHQQIESLLTAAGVQQPQREALAEMQARCDLLATQHRHVQNEHAKNFGRDDLESFRTLCRLDQIDFEKQAIAADLVHLQQQR